MSRIPIERIDPTNRSLVAVDGTGRLVLMAPPTTPITRQQALALAAWLTVLAEATDGEVLQARRDVEST